MHWPARPPTASPTLGCRIPAHLGLDPQGGPHFISPEARRLLIAGGVAAVILGVGFSAYAVSGRIAAGPTPKSAAKPSPTPSPSPSPTPTPTPAETPTAAPPPPAASPPVYIYLSEYGSAAAGTSPGASCSLSATYSDGSPVAGVRNPQSAGSDGRVQWSYPKVTRPPGTAGSPGTHRVTCSLNGNTNSDTKTFFPNPGL
jgi:hypothetical protein